jgi:glycosyltransferase involved in cell wall biosynthesis
MKFSIVTISFNQNRFLQETIDSIRVSPPHEVQYVIVDPGSTDGSRQRIENHRPRFHRVIFEQDGGPADGLNKGFAACDGDIYAYVNADDTLLPGALDLVARHFERNPETDVLFGAVKMVDAQGKPVLRGRTPDRFDLRRYADGLCFVWNPSTFIRREAFLKTGGFRVENNVHWDGELAVDLALTGAKMAYTNTSLGTYRLHDESMTVAIHRPGDSFGEKSYGQRMRVRERIQHAGVQLYSPAWRQLLKLTYTFNPARHLRYILAQR